MIKTEAKKRIDAIKKQMKDIDYAYYVLDKPIVSDAARDSLKDELEGLEKQYPEFITPDSPTQRIGGKALGKFPKYRHKTPKWSIDDVFSFDEVKEFDARIKRFLGLPEQSDLEYICELKIDGLNMSYIYKDGLLDRAVTRGDGEWGETVTHTTAPSTVCRCILEYDIEVGGEVCPKPVLRNLIRNKRRRVSRFSPIRATLRPAPCASLIHRLPHLAIWTPLCTVMTARRN
jgi:DNA ligase (NAD+)